jgi:class 3 adenylate cyclase/predicted ATPase
MTNDISEWLEKLGLGRYASNFTNNDIDTQLLTQLTHADLRELGISSLGHRKTILSAIEILGQGKSEPTTTITSRSRAERRQLTVMFCDLIGSTALSQRLDPEDLREINSAYQDTCKTVIEHYKGYVARYMGDGVLAYFGFPQAHEDDAERAIHAGLGVAREISSLDETVGNKHGVELGVRVGIATGPVVVGDLIGEAASQESAVVGETPNLAARLQSLASRDEVVIAPSTQALVTSRFEYENLGNHQLKGIDKSVQVWRVIGPVSADSRFEAAHQSDLTPLVGREQEIGLLLERLEQAKEGDGQVVLLSGETGIGKSRIIETLRERTADDNPVCLRYQCSPYHTNSALHPIIKQLERAAQFDVEDTHDKKLEKLKSLLASGAPNVEAIVPIFALLLSIPSGAHYTLSEMTPDRQKEQTLEALVTQMVGLSYHHPVLLIFEDVHWADPTSLELLELTIAKAQSIPVLVVITFRPEFSPPWGGHTHVTTLTLNRFTRNLAKLMVNKVTEGKSLPEEVQQQIIEKTDGVPLFVEELTKTILESGLLTEESDKYTLASNFSGVAIPATLHDSLMARLDRLANGKQVAQAGAVIGREFSRKLLESVCGLQQAELDAALGELIDSSLVFHQGSGPGATYLFKHALVQEAAYGSLLRTTRRSLHARIAEALMVQFPETAETQPEFLAHHFTEAANYEKAADYWRQSVERAIKHSAFREAKTQANKGLAVLTELPRTLERSAMELSLLLSLGVTQQALTGAGSVEVEHIYNTARDLCEEVGETWQQFSSVWGLWRLHESRANYRRARQYAEELLAVARNSEDAAFMLQAYHALWTTAEMSGDLSSASQHAEEGLRIYKTDEHAAQRYVFGGHDPAVCALGTIATVSWLMGYPDRAMLATERALTRARELNHPSTLTNCLANTICHYLLSRRNADLIEVVARELSEVANRYGFSMYSAFATIAEGWSMVEFERLEKGIAKLKQGLNELKATGRVAEMPLFRTLLAEALFRSGAINAALDVTREGLNGKGREALPNQASSEEYRMQGKLLQSFSGAPLHQAETWFNQALECARNQQARSLELRAAIDLARLHIEHGGNEAAVETLKPIYEQFTEGFDTTDLREAKALLELLLR